MIDQANTKAIKHPLSDRFRGFYPVVVDVETSGLLPDKHGLLEIAAVSLTYDDNQKLIPFDTFQDHIALHPECIVDPEAMKINGIKLNSPLRLARDETSVLNEAFKFIKSAMKQHHCHRAILVGHNAAFDLEFIYAAANRNQIKRVPFHPFSTLDTVSLSGLAYGQTVLKKACIKAGLSFNDAEAHSALYDAEKTAELFCHIVNRWHSMTQLLEEE